MPVLPNSVYTVCMYLFVILTDTTITDYLKIITQIINKIKSQLNEWLWLKMLEKPLMSKY